MDIIFLEPQNPANIGHLARVMKNFNCKNLILVNPQCNPKDIDALKISKHAIDVLEKSRIVKSFDYLLRDYDYIFATSAKVNTDYNILRSPINLSLIKNLIKKGKKWAIVFGREGSGLTNAEIKKCDGLIAIPASLKYPVMNISHAAAIILYEVFKISKERRIGDKINPINKDVKKRLLKEINSKLNLLDFQTKKKMETQKLLWKKIIGKSFLTNREAMAFFGFFKKIK